MAGKELLEQGEKRRRAILTFLQSYSKDHGFAPTIQEIADAVGLVSPNATRNHLQKLADLGFITMQPRIARAISVADPLPDMSLLGDVPQVEAKPRRRQTKTKTEVTAALTKPARKRAEKVPA